MSDAAVADLMVAYTRTPSATAPDWDDVVRRAAGGAAPAPKRRRSRRRLALAVALVLAVVLVPTALAFHRELTDLILGKPAPQSVKTVFERWNLVHETSGEERVLGIRLLADRFPSVDAADARGVAELDTPGGKLSLWEAPQRGGGLCWLFVIGDADLLDPDVRTAASGSCDRQNAAHSAIDPPQWLEAAALPGVRIIHVRVYDAASVELGLADGTKVPTEVVGAHAVVALPRDADPTFIVARGASGQIVFAAPMFDVVRPASTECQGICMAGGGGPGSA